MEKTIKLSKRLGVIAEFIPEGSKVVDVGTDHGYIPVWLAQTGKASKLYASDLREGPLDSARRTAAEYGVTDKIEFILTNGLQGTQHFDFDTVVIAGMGGETIISILDSSRWVLRSGIRLVIQPQSKVSELLEWLECNGIFIDNARLVEDEHRIYIIFSTIVGTEVKTTESHRSIPKVLFNNKDPLLYKYLSEYEKKIQKTITGLSRSEREDAYVLMKKLELELETIKAQKTEAIKWQQ